MKKYLTLLALSLFSLVVFAQNQDKVLDVWLTQYGDSKVTIKKDAKGKYYGEISWLKEPTKNGKAKLDDKNSDTKLQTRPIMGLRMLDGFVYKDGEWENGTIYNPKEGKTYKCYMWFEDNDYSKLHVKGYIGFSLIGKQVIWTRSK
ncbi:MAG: DUF2147 domain-containing protein [Bacteroidales bacterium]|nr:DUF2147 domain-containing protein [Bacteroidales bacterium]HPD95106.1 DUF2147 domain-containing protein [Tenuifilaceae bacterium]HRX31534.1 DUF2147 domain-containing protein [Tenuifilaceae bacterium]